MRLQGPLEILNRVRSTADEVKKQGRLQETAVTAEYLSTVTQTARDTQRQGRLRETTRTIGDLQYGDIDRSRPLETSETTRNCRDNWGLGIQ